MRKQVIPGARNEKGSEGWNDIVVEVEGGGWKTCQVVPDLEISPMVGGKAGTRGEVLDMLYTHTLNFTN